MALSVSQLIEAWREVDVGLQRKKTFRSSRPQPGCHLPNSPWPGIMTSYKLFPPKKSLVSDIPAGDGKIEKLFLRCGM